MNKDNAHSSSGKESLLKNTLYSWAGQLVFIISGFLLPRFISDFQGSDALGVWDFSWSIVNYLALSNLGIASSMNKYVAQYRAHSNFEGINRALSCVAFVQSIIGIFILSVSIVLYFVTPIFWADKLGNLTSDTQIVIFSLGSALALRTAFGALDGIITGFHRWDIYNILNSSTHAVTLVAMISSLLIANTLSALAIMYFLGALLNVVGKIIFSKRVFKQLHPSPRKIVKKQLFEMVKFGGKNFIISISRGFLYHANNIFIFSFLGPATLALYARPVNLVLNVHILLSKFTHTLTPVFSHLDSIDDKGEILSLTKRSVFYNIALALPLMLFIAISGGNIVEIWMGKEYRYDLLILVLALGHLCTMSHLSVYDILVGLNHHGPTAKANLLSSLIFISGAYILFKFMGGSLLAVAGLLGITLFILDGIWLPIFFARKLKINIYSFYNDTWKIPLLANLPFVVFLCFSSYYFEGIKSLIFDVTIGSFVLFITYWILIIPANLKSKLFPLIVRHS